MSQLQDALHSATKLGAFIEQFQRAKAVLEVAAQVESETASAQQRRAAALADAKDAEEYSELAKSGLNTALGEVAAAKVQAAATAEAATAEAREIVEKARIEAELIIAAAREVETAARDATKDIIAKARAAERQFEDVSKELAATHARLEQVRAEARKSFGV